MGEGTLVGRGIERQLVVLGVGAADGRIAEKQRRSQDRRGRVTEKVGDPEIFARCFNTGAKSALVNVVKDCAAHQLALAVGADAIEQARRPLAAQCLDEINRL